MLSDRPLPGNESPDRPPRRDYVQATIPWQMPVAPVRESESARRHAHAGGRRWESCAHNATGLVYPRPEPPNPMSSRVAESPARNGRQLNVLETMVRELSAIPTRAISAKGPLPKLYVGGTATCVARVQHGQ